MDLRQLGFNEFNVDAELLEVLQNIKKLQASVDRLHKKSAVVKEIQSKVNSMRLDLVQWRLSYSNLLEELSSEIRG